MVGEPHQVLDRVSPVLVGRGELLDHALRRWDTARAGAGHVLLLTGEPGIGKSRLLAELVAGLAGEFQRVDAAAFPRDDEVAGALIMSLADGLRRAGLASHADQVRDRLLADSGQGDAARRRRLLVGDLTELLAGLPATTPILMRIEDLHWADELSLDVLDRLAMTAPSRPILLLATYRSDTLGNGSVLGRWRARLLAGRHAEELRLSRLDAAGTAAMAEAITSAMPSAALVASLHARSDGIPLHIEELLASDPSGDVPDTVAEAVRSRVSVLGDRPQALLAAGAVVGRSFDLDVLAEVADVSGDELDRAIAGLVDAQLFVPASEEGSFAFRHALIGDAVYETIPPMRKRALHGAVAKVAERNGASAAFVSHHFERARESVPAHRHALSGAVEAARVSAHSEATELYKRAQRTTPADAPAAARAELAAAFAVELAAVDDNAAAAEQLDAAVALYRALGNEVSAGGLIPAAMAARHLLGDRLDQRAALAEDALERLEGAPGAQAANVRAGLLGALAAAHMLDRRLDQSIEFGQRASELAGEGELRADIDTTLGAVLVFAGRGPEGWSLLESSIGSSDAAGFEAQAARGYRMIGSSASVLVEYERAQNWIPAGLAYSQRTEHWNDHHYLAAHLAHVQWATGEWMAAERTAARALADGKGITTSITALTVLGYVAIGRMEFAAASRHLGEALELGEHMLELQRVSPALWGLSEVALREGRLGDAVAMAERGFAESQRVADAAYLFPFVLTGTRALVGSRDLARAREWLERCTLALRSRGIPGTLPALDHSAGVIELAEGHTGAARGLLESAERSWAAFDRHWEHSQALVDLAHCAVRSRRPAQASALVAELRESAEHGLFASLAERVNLPDRAGDGPLSARELEVARLVAAGDTNREIAAKLTISPKTASTHIEHILAKLAVSRRAEIAAWITITDGSAPSPAE